MSFNRLTRPAISAKPGCFTFAAASMSASLIESINPAPKRAVGLRCDRVIANGPIWFWIGMFSKLMASCANAEASLPSADWTGEMPGSPTNP